jgi:hypothetical protein
LDEKYDGAGMAHNLFRNSMAYVGEVPWHGLGRRVPADATAEAMIQAANLNWEVRKERALGARQISNDPPTYERYQIVREPVGPEQRG